MLEAAMLGIPYEGTIPDFAAQPARPRVPPSASSMAGQSVRQEQDWAYEQSLQVCMCSNTQFVMCSMDLCAAELHHFSPHTGLVIT